jgi:hypothetical protein
MPSEPVPPIAATNSPLRWMITIYAILALAAFAFPAGLREWLEERNADGRLWLPLAIARQVEAASDAVGVKAIGQDLKRRFNGLIGDQDS